MNAWRKQRLSEEPTYDFMLKRKPVLLTLVVGDGSKVYPIIDGDLLERPTVHNGPLILAHCCSKGHSGFLVFVGSRVVNIEGTGTPWQLDSPSFSSAHTSCQAQGEEANTLLVVRKSEDWNVSRWGSGEPLLKT